MNGPEWDDERSRRAQKLHEHGVEHHLRSAAVLAALAEWDMLETNTKYKQEIPLYVPFYNYKQLTKLCKSVSQSPWDHIPTGTPNTAWSVCRPIATLPAAEAYQCALSG